MSFLLGRQTLVSTNFRSTIYMTSNCGGCQTAVYVSVTLGTMALPAKVTH